MREQRTALILLLVLCFAVVSISQIEMVKAQEPLNLTIKPDGSVEGTDKIHRDGNVYIFTDNIVNQSVVVEIDGIIIDGADHLLQGNETGAGIDLAHRGNVTIKNLQIRDFNAGVGLYDAYNNTISENLMVNNLAAVSLTDSDNNSITENTIIDNENGIYFFSSYNNSVYGNSFINNTKQVFDNVWNNPWLPQLLSINFWDNGTTGNYWSSYNGTDNNGDGIGDTPYVIYENNQDNYPLITEFIIPEFPSWTPMLLILTILAVAVVIYRRRLAQTN
jgi:parallel beta-helix repeat protein